MTDIAVNQGAIAEFRVLQDYGTHPIEGDTYVCQDVAARGSLLCYAAAGIVALVSGAMPTTAWYLGFNEQNVVADNRVQINFGYSAQQQGATIDGAAVSGDVIALHRAARLFVVAVSGTVADGAVIYPQDGGKVGSTQIGSAPSVGMAVKGNNSVAGDPIELEIFLIGKRSMAT